jgi:hypothetical protein
VGNASIHDEMAWESPRKRQNVQASIKSLRVARARRFECGLSHRVIFGIERELDYVSAGCEL